MEKIMAPNDPNLTTGSRNPTNANEINKPMSEIVTCKLMNTSNKQKNFKVARRKKIHYVQWNKDKNNSRLYVRNYVSHNVMEIFFKN